MTQIKFKTPIAMKCTQEQYDRDLKQPLKELGYVENDMDRCGNSYNTLSTNWLSIHNYLGVRKEFNNTHLIPTYNPKLYIALAGMTVGEDWIVGEWLVYGDVLFKVTSISNGRKNYKKGFATNDKDAKIVYRKATKEELIEHFTEEVEESNTIRDRILKRLAIPSNYDKHDYEINQYCLNDVIEVVEEFLEIEELKQEPMEYKGVIKGFPQHIVEEMLDEQERQGNKRDVTVFKDDKYSNLGDGGFNWDDSILNEDTWRDIICNRQFHLIQQPKKDKFPFTLSLEEAKRIIKVAPTIYKIVLAQEWGENLILDGNVKVNEDFYSRIRNTGNELNLVLDEIFGKDEEFIPDGTPCLVRGYEDWGWNLRYADGKGEFYCDGFKYGNPKKWKYYQVLDINNLPVNE